MFSKNKNHQIEKLPSKQSGFTLIEVLIVVSITVVLAISAVFAFGNLQVSSQLNENTEQMIQTLRTAQERSFARINDSPHGVKFQTNKFILYQGTSYATRNAAYDRETVLDTSLTITTTLTNDEVNFSRQLGMPDHTGNVTLTHATSGSRQISINSFGRVNE
ncbi:prepilin-type N-terminal cleavage/methylation domain-containing protein [Patescibacteria group bacterium]|nr:prepilin-type N-terminal cleavage/methylation domain-containing protein [Patescibacteria group bacterium]